jgi:hypothetical protein
MSIQSELNQIYQTLRAIQTDLGGVVGKIETIEAASAQMVDAARLQNGLLNYIIDQQNQHGQVLRHILETIIGPPAKMVIFTIKVGNTTTEGATKVKLKANEEFDVAVAFQDAAKNPANVQGVPAWASNNEAVLTVTPSEDGLSAVCSTTGSVGSAQVSVSADADLGDGTTTITGVLDVEVLAGDAVLVVLNPGPARPKVTPTPPAP